MSWTEAWDNPSSSERWSKRIGRTGAARTGAARERTRRTSAAAGRPRPSSGFMNRVSITRDRVEAASKDEGERVRRDGGREQEPLVLVASVAPEELHLGRLLDALRHHPKTELAGHGNGGARDGGVLGRAGDPAHEGLVDLHDVDRKLLEVGDRGVAGAEVVDRQAYPEGAYRAELAEDLGIAAQHAALAQLELEHPRVDPALLQDLAHDEREVAAHELAERHVDGDA